MQTMVEEDGRQYVTPMRILKSPDKLRPLTTALGWKVFQELCKEPACSMDIAKRLRVHEQKVYYHMNQLRRHDLIKLVRTEERHGAVARMYGAKSAMIGVVADPKIQKTPFEGRMRQEHEMLRPFVEGGGLNARFIVGSPDPHGPLRSRASDACCAIDFALFLGSFTDGMRLPNYKLDTEVRDNDLRQNLILFGGPKTNLVTMQVNEKSPIKMSEKDDWNVVSAVSGQAYADDECGYVAMFDNPFDASKKILVVAGKRFAGTRAAVLAFIKHLDEFARGNKYHSNVKARVVRGIDADGDGIVDEVEWLE